MGQIRRKLMPGRPALFRGRLSRQQARELPGGSRAAHFVDSPRNQDRAGLERFDLLPFGMGLLELDDSLVESGKLGMKLVELFAILMVLGPIGLQNSLRLHWFPPNCVTPF